MKPTSSTILFVFIATIATLGLLSNHPERGNTQSITDNDNKAKSYILQGNNATHLIDAVSNVGGKVSREFPIINAISANLTDAQVNTIRSLDGVRVQDDRTVMTMNTSTKSFFIDNNIAKLVNAQPLHSMNVKGNGVTVAIIDSGANIGGDIGSFLFADSTSRVRIPLKYDAITGSINYTWNDDFNGHGTHITTLISSSFRDANGNFNSIAPDVNIIPVKAFDHNGNSSYSRVLDALNWIYENRNNHAIRIVNMSLGATAVSHYWQDPINQAVMRLWDAGIVVVVSAGNNGKAMGITVPGNTPYVLTVGAASDNGTPLDMNDDRIATFSAQGPTAEGFIKPDVIAYGTDIAAKMDESFFIRQLKASLFGEHYSEISGTSQAAALVTGVAALVLSNDPNLTPDDVKCRITSSARMAVQGPVLAISPFEQGSGLVDAYAAVMSTATACANKGLDIKQDIAGIQHFQGPARVDENGKFYIQTQNGTSFHEGVHWNVKEGEQTINARFVRINALSEINGYPYSSAAEFNLLDANGQTINRNAWTVSASNNETNYDAWYAIDGNPNTLWHTEWTNRAPGHVHSFTIDMGAVKTVSALQYLPRQDAVSNGTIERYEIQFSNDGLNWSPATVTGTLNGTNLHTIAFASASNAMPASVDSTRFVRINALSEINGYPYSSAAEFNLLDANGQTINRNAWTVSASNHETNYDAWYAIDGNPNTLWHTEWTNKAPSHVHSFTIDMGAVQTVSALQYLPRQDAISNGTIERYEIQFSNDGINWNPAIVTGTLNGTNLHTISFASASNATPTSVNLAASASLATSYVSPWENLSAINNGIEPTWSNDKNGGAYGNWRGEAGYNERDWVSLSWDTPKTISSFQVYWWMDYQGILQAKDAIVEYWDGNDWQKIDDIGTSLHIWNTLRFDPITTTKIRIEMRSDKSTGILEVKVLGHEAVSLDGMHWSDHVGYLQGMHWSDSALGLNGMHWSDQALGLNGMHWGDERLGLQGMHWSDQVMGLQGTNWGDTVINLLGMHWADGNVSIQNFNDLNTIGVQGVYEAPEPLNINAPVEVDINKWN